MFFVMILFLLPPIRRDSRDTEEQTKDRCPKGKKVQKEGRPDHLKHDQEWHDKSEEQKENGEGDQTPGVIEAH
jgi:hypothetical protein